MSESHGQSRPDRLAALLAEPGLDGLLVSDPVNLRYLTGFTGTNGVAVVGPEQRAFITDFRYVDQAEQQVRGFERIRGKQDLLGEAAERLSGRIGFDDANVSVRTHARLRELVGEGVELVPAGGLVEGLRAVKDAGEIQAVREAAEMADDVYEHLVGQGLVGRTEREVAGELEAFMRERGEGPSFPTIVAGGAHGALPHASPRLEPIEPGTLVIVDLGCLLDGYCSDCTRTFATGPLGDEAAGVYELVLAAQRAALEAVRAGVPGAAVDAVARELIAEAGHGERFGHGLGHGVGLEIHEGPRVSPTSEDELAAGNVVTVEPGVYVSGAFGVRIEDLVVVTDDGCEILGGFTKELVTVE
ncbi:MAG: M24 family metallopeptidase [Thermoleophilaceae bacterium]